MRKVLGILFLLAVLLPGIVIGCQSWSVEFQGETSTVGCGVRASDECPPSWTLSVTVVNSAADGAPLKGAAVTLSRLAASDVLHTDMYGRVFWEETGAFSPCAVYCDGLYLGTLDCLEEGRTDNLTTVTALADGFVQEVRTLSLTRGVQEVFLEFALQEEAP